MHKNKKGFVFVETILTIVVLTTTLVVLYTNYSRSVIAERRRLYYDDISYVYRTAVIRDILDKTINTAQWDAKVEETLAKQYIYVFNLGSQIFTDNKLISEARDNLHYNQLVYIPMKPKNLVQQVKDCINGLDASAKCEKTIKVIEGYSDATFKDYLKAIYVPEPKEDKIKGILISLIYETKNGNNAIPNGHYDNCMQTEILTEYGRLDASPEEQKDALKDYRNSGTFSVDMRCENAYYNSWVYL